jgi:allophanate hydrolase
VKLREPRALVAAGAPLTLNGLTVPPWTAVVVSPEDQVEIGLPQRRFAYLAVAGGIAVEPVLGSCSTYLVAGFGGHEGRRLKSGDRLPLGEAASPPPEPAWSLPPDFGPDAGSTVRVVPGPQSDLFEENTWDLLLGGNYSVAAASDRMGYRLEGPPLRHRGAASLPSEPVCPGAIQVPDGGAPIVLMPDGPTVGGYPKLAVVITADLGIFAQCAPGSRPDFALVTFEEAVAALRARKARLLEGAGLLRQSDLPTI